MRHGSVQTDAAQAQDGAAPSQGLSLQAYRVDDVGPMFVT
jgi:hypothetical protein